MPYDVTVTKIYQTLEESMLVMLARKLDNSPAGKDIIKWCSILAMDIIKGGITSVRSDELVIALDKWGREQTKWPTAKNIIDMMKIDRGALALPSPGIGAFSYETDNAKEFQDLVKEMRQTAGDKP